MATSDQVLAQLFTLARQMGEMHATGEKLEDGQGAQARLLAELQAAVSTIKQEQSLDNRARRALPDELLEYVRSEHTKAVAREKFWEDLRAGLLKRGIIGVVAVIAGAALTWGRHMLPALKEWFINWVNR